MVTSERRFSLIVFGATGFTGKTVVEEIVKTVQVGHSPPFTWAVAGRSVKKLKLVLRSISMSTGFDLTDIDTIEADIADPSSLEEMTRQCTLVLNTVGPFAKYGERVIKACLRTRTHQLDLSAEPQSLTELQVRYNRQAEEAGVYIIGSCGFHSVLNECGINHLQKQFQGDLNSVKSMFYTGPHLRSTRLNYGMWTSIIHFYAEFHKLHPLLRQLYSKDFPQLKYIQQKCWMIHEDSIGEVGWCMPYPNPDIWAVERSQHYFYEKKKRRPIQFESWLKQSNFFVTLFFACWMLFLAVIMKVPGGLYFLDHFPEIFSVGIISTNKGPTRVQMGYKYSMTLVGEGWDRPLNQLFEGREYSVAPNKQIVLKITGINPSYGSARTCLVQAAMTVLAEKDALPKKYKAKHFFFLLSNFAFRGGVFTPGTALAKTTIVERLTKHGLQFEFI